MVDQAKAANADTIAVRDVTLRDGLQSVRSFVPPEEKMEIFGLLRRAGVPEVQITSFVNPVKVPQLADADQVFPQAFKVMPDVNVLAVNLRGYRRAVEAGAKSIDAVVSVSETYNRKNANRSSEDSFREIETMLAEAERDGVTLGTALANCFHCFFEDRIGQDKVLAGLRRLADKGAQTVWICDTTGHAFADEVKALLPKCMDQGVEIGLHLHDTEGRAVENAMAGVEAGVRRFDAALGGIGGSPFTPGVGGNLSLEGFVLTLAEKGRPTGIDPKGLEAARLRLIAALESAQSIDNAA
jgi:hydroxymethylglutaryl-CoA lyase